MRQKLCFLIILAIMLSLAAPALAFSDVAGSAWYAEAVDYVVENGLFQGTGADTFSPDATMTRGMFMTVLGRMAGISTDLTAAGVITKTYVNLRSEPNTSSEKLDMLDIGEAVEVIGYENGWYRVRTGGQTGYIRNDLMSATVDGLADVPYTAYYAPYVAWAYRCGIASGTSSNAFSPDKPITREEICICLSRYCEYHGLVLPVVCEATPFSDEALLTDPEAVYELQQAGIIQGRDDGSFDPAASVKRSEVAALFQRYGNADVTEIETEEPVDNYSGYPLFAKLAPYSSKADSSYFDDACFIGHSLVVGMSSYLGLPNADYYAVSGISASTMLTYDRFPLEETYEDEDGNTVNELGTIADVLAENSYGKVYIMLGVNELGPEDDHANMYYNSMIDLVEIVQETQPGAIIYLISITPIGRDRSESSANFNRENALHFNDMLQQVSLDTGAYYIDAFGAFCDSSGYMPADCVTADGIHLLAAKYSVLKELLLTHTV